MRQLLRMIVVDGTGKKADAAGYRVGGKTGSAEKPGVGGYARNLVVSTFAAAFPMDNPRYIIVAMLDEPKGTAESGFQRTAGWTAAPVVNKTVMRIGPQLGIIPDTHRDVDVSELMPLLWSPKGGRLMLLSALIGDAAGNSGGARVTGFAIDHRKVADGTVFGAFRGRQVQWRRFYCRCDSGRCDCRCRAAQTRMLLARCTSPSTIREKPLPKSRRNFSRLSRHMLLRSPEPTEKLRPPNSAVSYGGWQGIMPPQLARWGYRRPRIKCAPD